MSRFRGASVLLTSLLLNSVCSTLPVFADDRLQGGVSQSDTYAAAPSYVPAYGAPKMVPVPHAVVHPPPMHTMQPKPAVKPQPKPTPTLKAGATTIVKPPPVTKPPVTTAAPVKEGVLPPQFLGRWQVMGSRSAVEAQPQFQSGINGIFSMTTTNVWTIQGSPQQGYVLSTDSGVSTPLTVVSQGSQAILKYQHPIHNTVAQEALVLQMTPQGVQFEGLERITIVKQGEPPRAKVTYNLIGHRQ